MTRSKMSFAPSWLLDEALKEEITANWDDTFDVVDDRTVSTNANVIPSHVVYKVKNEEGNVNRMKARVCPNGNRDRLKKLCAKTPLPPSSTSFDSYYHWHHSLCFAYAV